MLSEEEVDFKILTERPKELTKEEFFNMLLEEPKGLELTIIGLGKTFKSKWTNDKGIKPYGCFIDYTFTKDNVNYKIGLSYNLGTSRSEEVFILTSGMNIFKILAIAVDLSKAEEIQVTKNYLEKTLTGLKFIGKVGSGYNGFIIQPVKLIE